LPKHPNDKYGLDYPRIVKMEVMTPGPVNFFPITPEIMDEVASSYDPIHVLQAPLVVDHVERGPAYGHVLSLSVDDTGGADKDLRLIAEVGLLPEGVQLVESGSYPERSVMFLNYYPLEGIWYLNHLSLLGAACPAVIGLDPVDLADMTEEEMAKAGFSEVVVNVGKVCSERMHTWKKTERHLEFRIRPVSRFKSLEDVPINKNSGIGARVGVLKKKYVREGQSEDKKVNQALLFDLARWDMPRAKLWMSKRSLSRDEAYEPERLVASMERIDESVEAVMAEFLQEDLIVEAVWDETDQYIRHRLREPEDFKEGSFRTVDIGKDTGIKSVMGKLKDPSEDQKGMVPQNLMFNKSDPYGWTMEKAKQWVKDHPDFKASKGAENNPTSKENLTAIAEGGTRPMPETTVTADGGQTEKTIIVQAGSAAHLEAENAKLQADLEKSEAEHLAIQSALHTELESNKQKLRVNMIKTKVLNLQAVGYVAPAQVAAGLIEALAALPADAKVGEALAEDVILACLKFGGMIKLKGEIANIKETPKKSTDPDIDVLEHSGARVTGGNVARRARELRKEGKAPDEAYALAVQEQRGDV